MSPTANVRAIQALDDLRGALTRFGSEAQEALQAPEQEVRRTLDWLAERQAYWQREVQRRQEAVRQARAALARCRASAYYDPQTGRRHVPDCSAYEQALLRAQIHLQEAEAELRNVRQWIRVVEQAAAEFRRQAQRLASLLHEELPKATALLERKATTLRTYVALSAPSTGAPALSTTPPSQAVADTAALGVGLAALGMGLAGIAVLRWLARDVRQALGDVGEELSARLLREQFDLQELPFDPPKHGFDRVFTAPGVPLIILESKVHHRGTFHPGQTQAGEQGSPEWVAAHAEKMEDPGSAEWSPANERIAALIQELGPAHIPVVAVVIETETGRAAVYYRTAGTDTWQPLREGVSLAEALATASQKAGHPEVPGGTEREPGPEALEGGPGGAEQKG